MISQPTPWRHGTTKESIMGKEKGNHGMIQMTSGGKKDDMPTPGSTPKKVKKTTSKLPPAKKRKGTK